MAVRTIYHLRSFHYSANWRFNFSEMVPGGQKQVVSVANSWRRNSIWHDCYEHEAEANGSSSLANE